MAKSDDIPGTDPARKVNRAVIEGLKAKALALPGSGARLCLHRDQTDAVQEMIIVHRKGAYVRPHRHDGQTESFHVLEGRMLVVIFDDEGNVTDRFQMAPCGGDDCFMVRLADGCWHTMLPQTETVVFVEMTSGPFDAETHNTYAPWAPDGSAAADTERFLKTISP